MIEMWSIHLYQYFHTLRETSIKNSVIWSSSLQYSSFFHFVGWYSFQQKMINKVNVLGISVSIAFFIVKFWFVSNVLGAVIIHLWNLENNHTKDSKHPTQKSPRTRLYLLILNVVSKVEGQSIPEIWVIVHAIWIHPKKYCIDNPQRIRSEIGSNI